MIIIIVTEKFSNLDSVITAEESRSTGPCYIGPWQISFWGTHTKPQNMPLCRTKTQYPGQWHAIFSSFDAISSERIMPPLDSFSYTLGNLSNTSCNAIGPKLSSPGFTFSGWSHIGLTFLHIIKSWIIFPQTLGCSTIFYHLMSTAYIN